MFLETGGRAVPEALEDAVDPTGDSEFCSNVCSGDKG